MSAALPARAAVGESPEAIRRVGVTASGETCQPTEPGLARRLLQRALNLLQPSIGDLETAYRQHFLKADIDQAILGLRFILIPTVFFALSDYLLVGPGPTFELLVGVRAFVVLATLLAIRYVRGVTHSADLDRTLLIWSLTGIAATYIMNGLRPPTHTLQLGIQALLLLAIYLVVPNNLRARLSMAIFVIVMAV